MNEYQSTIPLLELRRLRPVWWAVLTAIPCLTIGVGLLVSKSQVAARDSFTEANVVERSTGQEIRTTSEMGNGSKDMLTDPGQPASLDVADSTHSMKSQLAEAEALAMNLQSQLDNAEDSHAEEMNSLSEAKDELLGNFREKSKEIAKRLLEEKSARQKNLEYSQNLETQKHDLIGKVAKLEEQLKAASKSDSSSSISGCWRFRVNVDKLVGTEKAARSVDWIVDYEIWLDEKKGEVSGVIVGTRDVSKGKQEPPSVGKGRIKGKFENRNLVLGVGNQELGAVSIYRLKLVDGKLIGELHPGNLRKGWDAFAGSVVGNKL